jgi:2-polyprenyl-3-methyl-5-hydroxy-6-metoxy-1,4-benzoquinol methylase
VIACLVCGGEQGHAGFRKGRFTYRRCSRCGLLSSSPLPSAREIEEHYRGKLAAGNYAVALRYRDRYRPVHEGIADWMGARAGDRVLDVGTFTGGLVEVLVDRGVDAYGVELQEEAVAVANEVVGGRVFRADIEGTAFPEGPYDVVSMIALIEHVPDPRQMIRRARELLVPAGRLYLETPNAGSLPARAARAHWPPLVPVEHIHLFSARALRLLLVQEGFAEVRVKPHVKWLPVSFVHEQLATFGGRRWQQAAAPFRRLLGETRLPFYVGEMLVSAVVDPT